MSDSITLAEYTAEVASIAAEVAKEAIEYNREISDVLHETIDGHQWVIYNAYHFRILQHSRNDEAYFQEYGPIEGGSLSDITTKLAFAAFYADVSEALPETEDCSECGATCLSDDLDEDLCKSCLDDRSSVSDTVASGEPTLELGALIEECEAWEPK